MTPGSSVISQFAELVFRVVHIAAMAKNHSRKGRTVEFDHNDLLIDHLQFEENLIYRIDLNLLSARPRHALERALIKSGAIESDLIRLNKKAKLSFVNLIDIAKLRISDIRDLNHVGEGTLLDLIHELRSTLIQFDESSVGDAEVINLDTLEIIRSRIMLSETIEELTEAMIVYLKSIRNVNEREEKIWRCRLPWITDEPRTLDSIGSEYGVTRERIRQIQRKSTRYSYEIHSNVAVLSEVQNILLSCTNHEEFREAMIEEELTHESRITIGRIRFLAVELDLPEVVSDVEKAIYSWSVN